MKTATKVKDLVGKRADIRAAVYHLSEPLDGHTYVRVSAVDAPFSGPETYIFGSDEDGEVVDWGELEGSFCGGMNHEKALRNAGYTLLR